METEKQGVIFKGLETYFTMVFLKFNFLNK